MKAFLTQVMIKSKDEALICVMLGFTKGGLHSSIGSMPTSKKTTDWRGFLQDWHGGGQNAKELSVSNPLISTHDCSLALRSTSIDADPQLPLSLPGSNKDELLCRARYL